MKLRLAPEPVPRRSQPIEIARRRTDLAQCRRAFRSAVFILCLDVTGVAASSGSTRIFNGIDLSGWRGGALYDQREFAALSHEQREALAAEWSVRFESGENGSGQWSVSNGEMRHSGGAVLATSARDFGNFELTAEVLVSRGAASLVYLRGVPAFRVHTANRPMNSAEEMPSGFGFTEGATPAQWHEVRVRLLGSRLTTWLDGKSAVEHAVLPNHHDRSRPPSERRPIPARGPIQLGSSGGEARWRNLALREIGNEETCRLLAGEQAARFEPIFNGRDLQGWAGPLEALVARNETLVWQKGIRGSIVYWNHELADFKARLQFKLPPGGNNGLVIRYPGTGRAAYASMCEVQIIDDFQSPGNRPFDPRQAHGSAYGLVAAWRGYQFPIGEWNFQEVTVRGSRLSVELNGTLILDADLANIDMSAVMDKAEHPGRTRTSGFFGFAGHSDPVEFKDPAIKRM